jgi:hypothetical protein
MTWNAIITQFRVNDKLKLKFIGISLYRTTICGNNEINESNEKIYECIIKLRDSFLAYFFRIIEIFLRSIFIAKSINL